MGLEPYSWELYIDYVLGMDGPEERTPKPEDPK